MPDFRDKRELAGTPESEIAKLIEWLKKGSPKGAIPTIDPLSGDRQTHVEKNLGRMNYVRLQEIYKNDSKSASEVPLPQRCAEESSEETSSIDSDTMLNT